jgi:hypothetical protein
VTRRMARPQGRRNRPLSIGRLQPPRIQRAEEIVTSAPCQGSPWGASTDWAPKRQSRSVIRRPVIRSGTIVRTW